MKNLPNWYYKYYSAWENTGWNEIWHIYLGKLLKLYNTFDEETKGKFEIIDTKEKYGTLRVYTSFDIRLNMELEMLSNFTCYECGKREKNLFGKYVIYTSLGYVLPYCKGCMKKYKKENRKFTKHKANKFSVHHYENNKETVTFYRIKNNWIEHLE